MCLMGRGSESPPCPDSFSPQKVLSANANICLQKRGFIFKNFSCIVFLKKEILGLLSCDVSPLFVVSAPPHRAPPTVKRGLLWGWPQQPQAGAGSSISLKREDWNVTGDRGTLPHKLLLAFYLVGRAGGCSSKVKFNV